MNRWTVWFCVVCSACFMWVGCSDDDEPTPKPTNTTQTTPEEDASDDVAQGDVSDDVSNDTDPDVPENEDQAKILAVPETKSWTLEGLTDEVHVVYTEMGVPNVYAKNRLDMGYALGFVVARDRFFIMDLQRRLGLGTISEVLGDIALDNDFESRILGMPYVTERLLEHIDEEDGQYLDAYAAGINAYIEAVRSGDAPPPSEFAIASSLLGASAPVDLMKPFDRKSIAAMVTVLMYETNFGSGDPGRANRADLLGSIFADEAPFVDLRRAGAVQDIWDNSAPLLPVSSTAGFGVEGSSKPSAPRVKRPLQPEQLELSVDRALLQRSTSRLQRIKELLGRKEVENFGSNTWAVQGSKTSDGAALVAGDGHLPLSVPALMYQIGLNTSLFGEGDVHQAGLLITSLPILAVGTNGHVAWSQVNPVADITDWYREEIQLDADGVPQASMFRGEWQPLDQVEEEYVIADLPLLESVGRTENWARWTTFDGRFLFDLEGRRVRPDEELAEGETLVNMGGTYIVPEDTNGDGVVSGISFDYTAFDTTKYLRAIGGFTTSKDVYDFQEATKGLVGNMLYSAVADGGGNILFTSYQGVPCRSYLPRDAEGRWEAGADPTRLLDGTQYGGFTIATDEDGKVDESANESDPYRCAVPFDETPQAINPPQGFVLNANNQPAPINNDGSFYDDPWYVGGPWSEFRADTIERSLQESTADNSADIDAMARLQGNTRSSVGRVFTSDLLETLERVSALASSNVEKTPSQERAAALYTDNQARFDEVQTRLAAWSAAGFETPSGVETFYNQPTPQDVQDSIATSIFNTWLPRFMQRTFSDENMGVAFQFGGSRGQLRALRRFLDARGTNPENLASWNEATGESIFFDVLSTPEVEESDEVILFALAGALDFLASEPTAVGEGGFGSADMETWIWGLRHQVRFESLLADFLPADSEFSSLTDLFSITTQTLPLATGIPAEDPRRGLKWFPRPGDNYAVDAASPGFSGTRFTHGSGPVMRMVISVKDGVVRGQNIIPGGQSALTNSPHFSDQAALWLENETVPIRYTPSEVAEGATGREVFRP